MREESVRLTIDADEEAEGDASAGDKGIGVAGGDATKAKVGACGRGGRVGRTIESIGRC